MLWICAREWPHTSTVHQLESVLLRNSRYTWKKQNKTVMVAGKIDAARKAQARSLEEDSLCGQLQRSHCSKIANQTSTIL